VSNKGEQKSFGPESEFYQRLKGRKVLIVDHHDNPLAGTLLWVDRYSLGLRLRRARRDLTSRELLVYKAGIATIELKDYDEYLGDETTDERAGTPTTP
jgi:hypothetical protein